MNLPELRSEIEKIDARIVELLNRRTELSIRIGAAKRATRCAFFAPAREEELLRSLVELNRKTPGPLKKTDLHAIYREIFSRSRTHQKRLTIGYAGGWTARLAAQLRFGSGEKYVELPSAKTLADALRQGKVDAGISPTAPAGTRAFGKVSGPGSFRLVVADAAPQKKSTKGKR